jgi:antitoxin PrlF
MKFNLIVSSRGQITLPHEMRKKIGISEGSVLIAEDVKGQIILRLATVIEAEYYTDEQISSWATVDAFASEEERKFTKTKLLKTTQAK